MLVAPMTSPDWLPTVRRAAAVVTDGGGMTCHAAGVARELRKPCIVGARTATTTLVDGQIVTVDGGTGEVLAGDVAIAPERPRAAPGPVTATKVYVRIGMPDTAEAVAHEDVDGVGLLRAEFMLTEALDGRHPNEVIAAGEADKFVDNMAASLERVARAFAPRPVIYRATDLRSNEFRGLVGGEDYEPVERNPMIGYRGCYRYVHDAGVFDLELAALARVRRHYPNVHLMIPFVRTRWELEQCLRLVDASPLGSHRTMQRWVMAEVPSVVYWLPEYFALGIHGVSIGSNDLTQLVLGVDRDSESCAELFDESDPAVLDVIGRIITIAREHGREVSLCGRIASARPEYTEQLVRLGITSLSVDPEAAPLVRRTVAAVEQRILLEQRR